MSLSWLQKLGSRRREGEKVSASDFEDLDRVIDAARREWQTAQQYYETVTDPDLIDHAIHLVTATERRYIYLLRQAQEMERMTHAGIE